MLNFKYVPWCEKYRVHGLADVRGQDLAVDKLFIFKEENSEGLIDG